MAIAEMFPYSDQHNLNLDWIIMKIKEFSGNQISGIEVTQIDTDTIKFVVTYTDGSTRELEEVTLPEGPQGPQGETGETGATPNLTAGTVTTLAPGSDATVSITGTAENPVLNLGIPQGIQGETGAAGGITNFDGYTGAMTSGTGIKFSSGTLSTYDLDLSETGNVNLAGLTPPAEITYVGGYLAYAFNSDRSIGKVYGNLVLQINNSGAAKNVDLDTGLVVGTTSNNYTILTGAPAFDYTTRTLLSNGYNSIFYIDSNRHLCFRYPALANTNVGVVALLPAQIYFFENFGDNPE